MRFLRLYRTFVVQHLKRLMEYRVDFLTGALSFLVDQLTNILFISIIFNQIPSLEGWTYNEILFVYGFALLPKGLDHLITDNLWNISYFVVRKGDFDKYLTRPINPLLHVIMEKFQFDSLGEFITGIVLVVYASVKLELQFTFVNIILLIVAVVFAMLIYTSIKITFSAIAFWTKQSGTILQIFYMTSDFAKYPITIYNKSIRFMISYVVPFAFTAYYPASYFVRGDNPLFNIGGTVIVSCIMLVISIFIWNKGIEAYESAGS